MNKIFNIPIPILSALKEWYIVSDACNVASPQIIVEWSVDNSAVLSCEIENAWTPLVYSEISDVLCRLWLSIAVKMATMDLTNEVVRLRAELEKVSTERDMLLCEVSNLRRELELSELKHLQDDRLVKKRKY